MTDFRFTREARTPHSESYTIDDSEHAVGRVDIHFTGSATYATLIVDQSFDDDAVHDLLEDIDDQIVTTADPYREDLIVSVWKGEEFGIFADDNGADDNGTDDETEVAFEPTATNSDEP